MEKQVKKYHKEETREIQKVEHPISGLASSINQY